MWRARKPIRLSVQEISGSRPPTSRAVAATVPARHGDKKSGGRIHSSLLCPSCSPPSRGGTGCSLKKVPSAGLAGLAESIGRGAAKAAAMKDDSGGGGCPRARSSRRWRS